MTLRLLILNSTGFVLIYITPFLQNIRSLEIMTNKYSVTDLIYRTVQVLRENLYWIRISTRKAGLMEPVKLQNEGQPSHMGSHEPHTEYTRVPNIPNSVYRIHGNVKTHKLLLQEGVMYLSIQFLLLDNSLLHSDSQNIQELICWAIL